jgi:hypothetical protein
MQHRSRWLIVGVIVAGLQLSACKQKPDTSSKSKPATVERLQGTELSRVILTTKAAERLDIKTAPVRNAQVARKWLVGGEIVALPPRSAGITAPDSGTISASAAAKAAVPDRVWVLVPISHGDRKRVARGQPARVLPLARDYRGTGFTAQPVDDDDEEEDDEEEDDKSAVGERKGAKGPRLYYVVSRPEQRLVPGHRVRVEVSLSNSGERRKVVPYAAVLYDTRGDTWVYTNPEPLVFVRHRVSVDYIEGDLAVLSDGPPSGTPVVTVGAAELFGIEFEIGK